MEWPKRQNNPVISTAGTTPWMEEVEQRLERSSRNLMLSDKGYYVYLLTNWNNKVMYVGMTNDLVRRLYEHKNKLVKGFTTKYNIDKLVYFEEARDVHAVITREKEIKRWRREKKDQLVVSVNPDWKDLSLEWKDFSLRSK